MNIVPLGPGFAAELRDVTIAEVASDDTAYAAVRAAFEEHSVPALPDRNRLFRPEFHAMDFSPSGSSHKATPFET